MRRVVVFDHRGVQCAVPAEQVLQTRRESGGLPEAALWHDSPGEASGGESPRVLRVATPVGERAVHVGSARVSPLTVKDVQALPDLLHDLLGLPHVVGLAWSEQSCMWLVDMGRWRDAEGERMRVSGV